jgi:hypothetical protein
MNLHPIFKELINTCYDNYHDYDINDEGITNYPDLQKIVADIKEKANANELSIAQNINKFIKYINDKYKHWNGDAQFGTLSLLYECELLLRQ